MSPSRLPITIVLGGVIIAVAVYASLPKTPTLSGNPALVRPVGTSDHILGNPVAPVLIVEYSDFDCDYCQGFNETLHQLIASAGTKGNVAWVYRHFPLTALHPNALSHARAAECAAEVAGNDAFWQFAKVLYRKQPVDPSSYGEIAASVGIESEAFATCYANVPAPIDARIQADEQNALTIGAQGTPYSLLLVAGKPPVVIDNAYSYDAVKALVDQALLVH